MGFFTFISFSKSLPLFLLAFVIANSHSRQDLPSVKPTPCIYEHFSALLQLKTGLQFSFHQGKDYYHSKTNLSSWVPENRDCCSWEGITCDRATGLVTSLCLGELDISGKINFESLCRIRSLQILDLAYNMFQPSLIASAVGQLTSLSHLNLSHCGFFGQIPLEMSSLTRLVSLDLSFSGILSFNGNYDDDDHLIPLKLESIGALIQHMSSLRELNLNYVDMSAEDSQWSKVISSALPNLRMLRMRHCNLTGILHPSWLTNLTKLEYLELSRNNLYGTIPSSLFTFPSLRTLRLYRNQLGGQLSEFHSSSSSLLETIDLSQNELEGKIPRSIFQLRKLNVLDLGMNNFSGVLDQHIFENLTNLLFLDLSDNALNGSLPILPHSMTALRVSRNHLSGEIPASICNASSLATFDISSNNFSGLIPQCLGEMSNALTDLDLRGNSLSGKLPASQANCKNLAILALGNNQIHDIFPSWVYTLAYLRIFILRSNNFYGPIQTPSTCQNFSNLQIVDLSFNNFNGSLPPTMFCGWKKMTGEDSSKLEPVLLTNVYNSYKEWAAIRSKRLEMNLTVISIERTILDLSRNQFQGQIPESIGNLKSLWTLNMSHNGFTGHIPLSFKNLTALESLDLSQNHLSGNIPLELSEQLTFLEVLDLSENQLIGNIPHAKQFSTFTNESFQGNPGLCGPPLTKACEDTDDSPSSSSEDMELFYESEYSWKMIAIGFGIGYGVGVGAFSWTLVLWTRGRRSFNRFVYRALLLIYPSAV